MKIGRFEKFFFYAILTLFSIIAMFKMHEVASLMRINDTWGGELTLVFIPLIVWYTISNIKLYF